MVTKQDIKDAAFKLIARHGYAETSTEAIANSLGLKKQSLYSHFTSKAEIFDEILQDQSVFMIGEVGGKMKELSDQPADIKLKGIFEKYISVFSNRDRLLLWKRVVLMTGSEEYNHLVNGMILQFDKALSLELYAIFKKDYPSLDQRNFSCFFLSYMVTIFGYLDWMLINNHDDYIFNFIWSNFWDGAKNQLSLEFDNQES